MTRVSVNGLMTAYVESGDGEPLILIHGGQSDRRQFDVFRPLLGEGIRAIAYDQRDAPDQPYEGGPYSIRDHAEDCAAFLTAIGLEKAHLMGTSYGGTVAMMTAILFPDRVQSLILSSTTPSWDMTEPVVADTTSERDPAAIERFMLEKLITPEAIDQDPVLVSETKAAIRARPAEAIARRMAAVLTHDCRDDLRLIQSPTLVLHGEDDPLISARTAAWTAEHIDGAELRVLPDSRHGLTLQHRARTAEIVRSFVLKASPGKQG